MRLLPGSEQLRDVLRAIERAFREIWPAPFRTQQLETAALPAASAHKGGIVYDLTADRLELSDGTDWNPLFAGTVTAFGRSLLDDADDEEARSTLGLGTIATQDSNGVAITGGSATGLTTLSATTVLGTTVAGSGISAFGAAYMNRLCRQPLAGERYLLLVNKSANNRAIIGNIRGRRNQASGAGNNMGDFYVFILCNSSVGGGWRVHWEVKRTNNAIRLVELTYQGETWYAMDAMATGASSPFDGAVFEGCIADSTDMALTWVLPSDVSGVTAVGSDATINFANMATISGAGFACASGTSGSPANVVQASSGGALARSTSSIRYKTDVQPIALEEARMIVEGLEAVTFRSLSDLDDPQWRWPGLVAEQVAALSPHLVHWRVLEAGEAPIEGAPTIGDGAGRTMIPEAVFYDRIAIYQNLVIRDLLDRVAALEARRI